MEKHKEVNMLIKDTENLCSEHLGILNIKMCLRKYFLDKNQMKKTGAWK